MVRGPDGYAVAQAYTTIEDDGNLMRANARLIAAAPDLLAAAEKALYGLSAAANELRSGFYARYHDDLKALIAKVKGE